MLSMITIGVGCTAAYEISKPTLISMPAKSGVVQLLRPARGRPFEGHLNLSLTDCFGSAVPSPKPQRNHPFARRATSRRYGHPCRRMHRGGPDKGLAPGGPGPH